MIYAHINDQSIVFVEFEIGNAPFRGVQGSILEGGTRNILHLTLTDIMCTGIGEQLVHIHHHQGGLCTPL